MALQTQGIAGKEVWAAVPTAAGCGWGAGCPSLVTPCPCSSMGWIPALHRQGDAAAHPGLKLEYNFCCQPHGPIHLFNLHLFLFCFVLFSCPLKMMQPDGPLRATGEQTSAGAQLWSSPVSSSLPSHRWWGRAGAGKEALWKQVLCVRAHITELAGCGQHHWEAVCTWLCCSVVDNPE